LGEDIDLKRKYEFPTFQSSGKQSPISNKKEKKRKKRDVRSQKKSKKWDVPSQKTTQTRLRKRKRMLCPQYNAGNWKKY